MSLEKIFITVILLLLPALPGEAARLDVVECVVVALSPLLLPAVLPLLGLAGQRGGGARDHLVLHAARPHEVFRAGPTYITL